MKDENLLIEKKDDKEYCMINWVDGMYWVGELVGQTDTKLTLQDVMEIVIRDKMAGQLSVSNLLFVDSTIDINKYSIALRTWFKPEHKVLLLYKEKLRQFKEVTGKTKVTPASTGDLKNLEIITKKNS